VGGGPDHCGRRAGARTILFTASFRLAAQHQVFAETFVLQQTQPLIAIVLAWIVLGERRRPWFWPACCGGDRRRLHGRIRERPVSLLSQRCRTAGSRLGCWPSGLPPCGPAVQCSADSRSARFSFWSMTALRFTLALPVLVIVVLVQNGLGGFGHYRFGDFVPNLLAIAIVPGLLALLL